MVQQTLLNCTPKRKYDDIAAIDDTEELHRIIREQASEIEQLQKRVRSMSKTPATPRNPNITADRVSHQLQDTLKRQMAYKPSLKRGTTAAKAEVACTAEVLYELLEGVTEEIKVTPKAVSAVITPDGLSTMVNGDLTKRLRYGNRLAFVDEVKVSLSKANQCLVVRGKYTMV